MNYTLQLHGERMLYPVPSGLYELTSDIAREVLRDQPSLVYQYIAHYLDTLVRVREYARVAGQLVDGVTQENVELLSYLSSLGVPYDEANEAARKIQRAYRAYRAKRTIKQAVQEQLNERAITANLQELLDTYNIDRESADRAAKVIQTAFRAYRSKKMSEERKGSRDASTHTIESIALKPPLKKSLSQEKKPPKRDSKLMVYQQSTKESVMSTWSTLARDSAEKGKPSLDEDRVQKLVYEQTDISSWTSKQKIISDYSVVSADMVSLPSYYDETQPKIPMISESGLLVSEEPPDIVTLFSTDSVDENRRLSEFTDRPPSFTNLSPTSKPEDLAKELFDIIGNKTSTTSKSRLSKTVSRISADGSAKTGKEHSTLVKESSKASVSGRNNISIDRAT